MEARKGMTFCLNVGFNGLQNSSAPDKEGKTYALVVGDTVVVNDQVGGWGGDQVGGVGYRGGWMVGWVMRWVVGWCGCFFVRFKKNF